MRLSFYLGGFFYFLKTLIRKGDSMLKSIKDSEILKRYSQPPGEPPDTDKPKPSSSIAAFPTAPLDMPTKTFENALKRREKNHRMLIQWIQKNLKPDIHYGRTHIVENCKYARTGAPHLCSDFSHMSMITLWKAGAEKILGALGLSVRFPNVHQYELACVHKQEISTVVLKCELRTSNGTVIAEGSGARHINEDGYSLNKTIKMAGKSAMIDATIRVAGLSGVFIKTHRFTLTKLGDCNKNDIPGMEACHTNNLTSTGLCNQNKGNKNIKLITQRQKDFILDLAGKLGLTIEDLNKRCLDRFKSELKNLERHYASKFIQQLNEEF